MLFGQLRFHFVPDFFRRIVAEFNAWLFGRKLLAGNKLDRLGARFRGFVDRFKEAEIVERPSLAADFKAARF